MPQTHLTTVFEKVLNGQECIPVCLNGRAGLCFQVLVCCTTTSTTRSDKYSCHVNKVNKCLNESFRQVQPGLHVYISWAAFNLLPIQLTVDAVCRVSRPPLQWCSDGPVLGFLWSYRPRLPFPPHTAELHDATLPHIPAHQPKPIIVIATLNRL